jgi:hypothetical protein
MMKPVRLHDQRVRNEFERLVHTEADAMRFENRHIEPIRDVLRSMATDDKLCDEVLDSAVKLQLREWLRNT